jgi:Spy/CpxP family protein refolding chaperone
MTIRRFAPALLLALALPTTTLAQEGEPTPRRAPTPDQREHMRQRIHTRFLDMAAERLELDATQRTRLASVLEQHHETRREITEEGMRLRREAADLLGTDSPDRARAERILDELTRLRERELQLWRAEQDALADVLTPTQRLELMAMQARFGQRVRDIRSQHMHGGAPRFGPR